MGNNSTSSVMISMDADTDLVKKEIKVIEKELSKLETKKISLTSEMEFFKQKAQEAEKELAVLNERLASLSDKDLHMGDEAEVLKKQIFECENEIQGFADKANKAENEIKQINLKTVALKKSLSSLKLTGTADESIEEVGEKVKKSLGKSEKAIKNFGARFSRTIQSALVFSVLYKGLNELKQRLSAMLGTNQQFNTSLNQVKSNLAVAFQPIYQAAMPAINSLMNLLVKATAYIAAFVNALFGASMNSSIDAAREMERTVNAVESGATGASKAEKELTAAIKEKQKQVKALQRENKQLQREYEAQQKAVEAQTEKIEKQISAFEKQIDAIEAAESAMNKSAAAQREAIQANIDVLQKQQNAISKEYAEIQKQEQEAQKKVDAQKEAIDKQIKSINKRIKALQKQQREEEKAKKANEKFSASFDELSTLGSIDADDPTELEIEQLQEEIELLQERKEQIEDIDYSARLEALDAEKEKIQEQIELLQAQKDAIEDVDLSGSIDVYESRISSLREKIDELNNSVVENPLIEQNELLIEQLQEEIDLLQEQKDAIAEASGAASSFDASGLTNFKGLIDDITERIKASPLYQWLSDNQEEIMQFITILGGLLAIIVGAKGIVWAFKHFGDILAWFRGAGGPLMLLLAGISALIVMGGNAQEVIDNVKEAFKLFGEGLTALINGDFETFKTKFTEGFYNLANAALSAAESIVRALQKALRWILEKIGIFETSVPEDSPFYNFFDADWALKNWKSVNEEFSLPRVSYEVPALASGAVLPPNKPFYAILGDQKNGTNLEAPEGLIRQIFQEELDGYESDINITFGGTMGGFVRSLNPKITREKKRKSAFKEELENA